MVVEINLNLDALVAAAQAAISKGPEEPWFDGDSFPGYDKEDREFIAAASPQVMIELVRRLRASEGMLGRAVEICREQGRHWDSDDVIADRNYADHCADLIEQLRASQTT